MTKSKCKFYETGVCKCGKHDGRELLGRPMLGVTADAILSDLTVELPQWKLSSYAPGNAKVALISNRDISPEEMRWQAYMAKSENATDKYIKLEKEYEDILQKQRKNILADLKGATQYVISSLQQSSPPRTQHQPWATQSSPAQAPRIGRNATSPNVSAFSRGQSSSFGQHSGSAFGQTSSLKSNVAVSPAGPQVTASFSYSQGPQAHTVQSNLNTAHTNGTTAASSGKPLGTLFGSAQQSHQSSGPDSKLPQNVQGTSMQDMPREVMEIFKSDRFEAGKIPEIPPPWEIC